MQSLEALVESFRRNGFKITPQRRMIFELLCAVDNHPTAEEVYQRALSFMPDITRKTVYNTLRELIELNHLCPVLDPSKHGLRYDTTTDLHHHLVCLRCHALLDIHHDFAGVALAQDDTAGYRIIRHQVTFYGYCPACRINEDKQAN